MAREETVRDAGEACETVGGQRLRHCQLLVAVYRSLEPPACLQEWDVRGRLRERTASALNSSPMPVGEIRRCTPASMSPRLLGVGRHQPSGALGDAQAAEEFGLGHRAVGRETRRAGLARESSELHVGGEVGMAGSAERIDPGVPAHGLQRVARRRLGRAVVDEERDAEAEVAASELRRATRPRPARSSRMAPGGGRAASASVPTITSARPRTAGRRAHRHRPRARARRHRRTPAAGWAGHRGTRWRSRSPPPPAPARSIRAIDRNAPAHVVHATDDRCGELLVPASAGMTPAFGVAPRAEGRSISIRCTLAAARNGGTACAARRTSRIKVPRPGPSSTRRSGAGLPMPCQATAHHRPISSPKPG